MTLQMKIFSKLLTFRLPEQIIIFYLRFKIFCHDSQNPIIGANQSINRQKKDTAMKQEGPPKVILEFERLVSTLSNPAIHLERALLLDLIFAALFRRKIRFFESF